MVFMAGVTADLLVTYTTNDGVALGEMVRKGEVSAAEWVEAALSRWPPFAGRLESGQHDQLLDAVIENGQNWDAADTPSLLLGMLRDATPAGRPTHDARNRFYQRLRRMRRLDRYSDVLALFQADGWVVPPPQPDDEE